MEQQRYYLDVAACAKCAKIYPVAESNDRALCLNCKQDALNWPLKEI